MIWWLHLPFCYWRRDSCKRARATQWKIFLASVPPGSLRAAAVTLRTKATMALYLQTRPPVSTAISKLKPHSQWGRNIDREGRLSTLNRPPDCSQHSTKRQRSHLSASHHCLIAMKLMPAILELRLSFQKFYRRGRAGCLPWTVTVALPKDNGPLWLARARATLERAKYRSLQ